MRIIAIKMAGLDLKLLGSTDLAWKPIDQYAAVVQGVSVNMEELYAFGSEHEVDFLPLTKKKKPKLALFDMDSTLVAGEVINELAALKNCEAEIALITNKAMNGEIDFDESLKQRLHHLKGIRVEELSTIHAKLPLNPGAQELMKGLKKLNVKTYIASGGFDFFAHKVAEDLKMDGCFSNTLEIENGKTTGKILGPIINAQKKKEILLKKAQDHNLSLEETMAIGDGANDLEMIRAAGYGVAYHAKHIVKEKSPIRLNYSPLHALLYIWKE